MQVKKEIVIRILMVQLSIDSLKMVLGSPLSPGLEGGLEISGKVLLVDARVDKHAAH